MSETREFLRVTHVAYGMTLVRIASVDVVHPDYESQFTMIRLTSGHTLKVEEGFGVVARQMLGRDVVP